MVMAWVDVKMGSEIIASTERTALVENVGTQVANAMTKWMEHLPYPRDRYAHTA